MQLFKILFDAIRKNLFAALLSAALIAIIFLYNDLRDNDEMNNTLLREENKRQALELAETRALLLKYVLGSKEIEKKVINNDSLIKSQIKTPLKIILP